MYRTISIEAKSKYLEDPFNSTSMRFLWHQFFGDLTKLYYDIPYYLTVNLTFVHGPTLHFSHYVGQSGSSPCSSIPTNATYKSCKYSSTRLVLCTVLAVIWITILTSLLRCNILNHLVNESRHCLGLPIVSVYKLVTISNENLFEWWITTKIRQ